MKKALVDSPRWCALAVGLAIVAGCREAPQASPPPPAAVDVARPIVRDVTEWDEFTGRLAAIDTVDVRPRVSGYLESVHFREGQFVKKGDLLFVIDPRPFRAVLSASEAEIAAAVARLELAKNDLARAENLVQSRAISTEDFDRRSKAVVEAQAVLDGSKARLEQARLDVEFTEVRAPVDGRASNVSITVGNLVSGGSTGQASLLTSIVSMDPIYCYFTGSEQEYLKYTRLATSGARPSSRDQPNPVRLALLDESEFIHQGHMDFVDNRIDELTGTIRARAVFENPNGDLLPGMFVRVQLIGETRTNAVLIPDAAIGADQSNRVVYVVNDQNIVALRTVETGRLIDGLRVITSGLAGDEWVIVSGVQRVRPGSEVTPTHLTLPTETGAEAAAPRTEPVVDGVP
jgi:RND family efflux transporter MFP subunit